MSSAQQSVALVNTRDDVISLYNDNNSSIRLLPLLCSKTSTCTDDCKHTYVCTHACIASVQYLTVYILLCVYGWQAVTMDSTDKNMY
jgi:hypothetical protein